MSGETVINAVYFIGVAFGMYARLHYTKALLRTEENMIQFSRFATYTYFSGCILHITYGIMYNLVSFLIYTILTLLFCVLNFGMYISYRSYKYIDPEQISRNSSTASEFITDKYNYVNNGREKFDSSNSDDSYRSSVSYAGKDTRHSFVRASELEAVYRENLYQLAPIKKRYSTMRNIWGDETKEEYLDERCMSDSFSRYDIQYTSTNREMSILELGNRHSHKNSSDRSSNSNWYGSNSNFSNASSSVFTVKSRESDDCDKNEVEHEPDIEYDLDGSFDIIDNKNYQFFPEEENTYFDPKKVLVENISVKEVRENNKNFEPSDVTYLNGQYNNENKIVYIKDNKKQTSMLSILPRSSSFTVKL